MSRMSLFRTSQPAVKDVATAPRRSPPQPAPQVEVAKSVLSAGTSFTGADFQAAHEDLEVQGRLDGRVNVRHLTVAIGAVVSGEIYCEDLVVYGTIDARVWATNVALHPGCDVRGTLSYHDMAMKRGARINAQLLCEPEPAEPAARRGAAINDAASAGSETGARTIRVINGSRMAG